MGGVGIISRLPPLFFISHGLRAKNPRASARHCERNHLMMIYFDYGKKFEPRWDTNSGAKMGFTS